MFGKKEISPAEMRELNEKSFKNTQAIFRRRIREIASSGENKARYKEEDYCAGEYVKGWLRSLGFTCKEIGWGGWVEITWKDDRRRWKKDNVQWDYVCPECEEHSEYETKFCPNCGARMEGGNGT